MIYDKAYHEDVIISFGLLEGHTFSITDLENIYNGTFEECFGHKKIFDETFDITFE